MPIRRYHVDAQPFPTPFPAWQAMVAAEELPELCRKVAEDGGRLLALWGEDVRPEAGCFLLRLVLAVQPGFLVLTARLSADRPVYPDLASIFPQAARMQRATYDLLGLEARDAEDTRPWLRHGVWGPDDFPLRRDVTVTPRDLAREDYPFVRVEGEGVHEIPVGPVHAGTIEPGHFRFSVVGERILRLEERLGYKHKGIERRAQGMPITQAARLVGRVSGDSTCAYAWSYAMAVEAICETSPPPRALWLRALLLERERLHNHLGDLGYLGNDVGLAFGFAQFWILKEEVLRHNAQLFGHRYLMDRIVPGGVTVDLDAAGRTLLEAEAARIEDNLAVLREIYEEHAGCQDRFLATGRVAPELAARLGLTGLAGRASGQAWDMRAQFPVPPYDVLDVRMATHRAGDVAARVTVRFDEITESLRLCRLLLAGLPDGPVHIPLPPAPAGRFALGLTEAWRGEVFVALTTGPDDTVARLHPHDPSWQNWPLLEHAVMGNIVPDFPLINKSFNLSYSGHDL